LEKPLCTRSRNIVKISTAFLLFTLLLFVTTHGDCEINDKTYAKDIAFHEEIIRNLAETGNSIEDVLCWQKEHPNSSLRFLSEMLPEEQEAVALLVQYIKTVNPELPSKTLWREACAFVHYAKKYGVPGNLLVAVANTESHFDPKAISKKGAVGVMQVVWNTHAGLLSANGITSKNLLHDPELGIAAGALLLSRYIRAYGSEHKALDRYYGTTSSRYRNLVNKNLRALKNSL